ncbi:MAG: sigma 54-interacting transcriptional regulator [Polyangiaceae bacterium]|nr:sigma 54-interacting transcriptional regulator [Polyangiaceae bacterium]
MVDDREYLRLEKERDLYLGLLRLNAESNPEPFLETALALIVETSGAQQGYLEVFNQDGGEARWWRAAGCSEEDVEHIRRLVSRGIIAEAVASGEVVMTPSALLDPRFKERASVQRSKIDAVLCAPIGADTPLGVLYLLRQDRPGVFDSDELARAKLFTRHLAPLVEKLFTELGRSEDDPTRPFRAQISANSVVGKSRAVAALLEEVAALAKLDVGVLIMGETGTGKTQIGRVIHENSSRSAYPLVEVNCAAIPEQLLESELFGAMPGSHATAVKRREGKVAAAQGGTLVLDEIGELALGSQAKLLQLLQDKEYFPLGAARSVSANVRVIATTNVDLKQAVADGTFRKDLYYRLQIVSFRVPSIRERPEDLPLLAAHFCERAQQNHGFSGLTLSPGAVRALTSAEWPGNIRELSHTIEAAAIRAASRGLHQIDAEHLFPETAHGAPEAQSLTFQEETRRFQAELVRRALDATEWNVSATARQLDLTRAHLYNLIKTFGISRR